jgi:hypothetical protein
MAENQFAAQKDGKRFGGTNTAFILASQTFVRA